MKVRDITTPKRDDPATLEMGSLDRLLENPDFRVYLAIVRRTIESTKPTLCQMIKDEEALARHNFNAGALWGMDLLTRVIENRKISVETKGSLDK